MSAVRMDGKALSAKVRSSILAETEQLKQQGITPGLAVIIVGNDPASEIYVRNKEKACAECGFYSEKYALPAETSQDELLGLIDQLNHSPADLGHPVPAAGAGPHLRAGGDQCHRPEKGCRCVPPGQCGQDHGRQL